jgi:glycosyltransferase involved in cell wall biosynthesis
VPAVSIIVPIYNISQYLQECLDSLLDQTFSDIEIILVDDGSTDDCPQICDAYEKKDSRVKVIHKPNAGLVSARKAGLRAAKGRYIGYVDGDDWIEPDMYARMYQTLTEQKVDIVMCGRYEDTMDVHRAVYQGLPEGRYDKSALQKEVYPRMIVNGAFFEWGLFPGQWDKLFRRECLESFQMEVDDGISMGEDAACVYPCLLHAESIYVMRDCLYHYRQSTTSMVKKIGDAKTERKKYDILYHSVKMHLEEGKDIYDLTGQWRDYLLFLMTPRADILYEGIEKLDYLFPFPKVKKGSRILVYGMGVYGQRLCHYIKKSGVCNWVASFDRNYAELQKQGIEVLPPEKIADFEYDDIVIACSYAKTRQSIYLDLKRKYPNKNIHVMDEELVKSDETLRAFGLL